MQYKCKRCSAIAKAELYETGEEFYCNCQNTVMAEFDIDLWERIDV